MIVREKQLEQEYGFKTCRDKKVPDRFMKGLPSSEGPVLALINDSKESIKSSKAFKAFQELNGFSSSFSMNQVNSGET